MVVLAASLVTKTGKALISRQYVEMSRIRIEGLLAAFPKLVSTGKQHTFVETENVRYVYQPIEGLYMLLITNKQSNILEDLDTLRLLAKIVPEYAPAYDEETVIQMAFELVSAFDEVITPSGSKENITVMQVKQNCAMESHEEKLHKMILQSKIDETKANMKKKALEIDKTRAAEQSKNKSSFVPTGLGSSSSGGAKTSDASYESKTIRPDPITPPKPVSAAAKGPSKGMQLGKGKKGADILQSLAKEGEAVEVETPVKASGISSSTAVSSNDPVALVIEEKLTVLLNKQGGCENVEVQGTLSLVVSNDEDALIRVAVTSPSNKSFQFKTHPNIDKAGYSSNNILGLKDPSRPFPLKSELGILKWRMQAKDDSLVPITINCWPSISGGQTYVNIEYESTSDFDLQDVTIAIPLPGGAPSVNQVDGEWRFDSKRNALLWTLDLIDDTNRSGSMEFVVAAADPDTFYPVEVAFTSNKTFCDIAVESVTHTTKETPVKFSFKRLMTTESYSVE